jgi:tRNA(Ile)-lysidine synthase
LIDYPPFSDRELAGLFAPLERCTHIVLAVSGGPDSLALMLLVNRWRLLRGIEADQILVATVDHGLRASSHDEAVWVTEQAEHLGLPSKLLTWDGPKPQTGVLEAARAARYDLLVDVALSLGGEPVAIVTAHTEDDQAETFLMRLARGSGVDGLAAMRAERELLASPYVLLVRPLLDVSKARLVAEVRRAGVTPIDDPSNSDERYERVRLRRAEPVLRDAGLSAEMIALSAKRLNRAHAALDVATDALVREALSLHGGAYANFDAQLFLSAPDEIQIRVLSRVIRAFGGSAPQATMAQIERLRDDLARGDPVRQTLGGTVIRATSDHIRIFRETGRVPLPEVVIPSGEWVIWDDRFLVVAPADQQVVFGDVTVRALPADEFVRWRHETGARHSFPARAALTLPSLWREGQLVAAPDFGQLANIVGGPGPCSFTNGKSAPGAEFAFIYDNRLKRVHDEIVMGRVTGVKDPKN